MAKVAPQDELQNGDAGGSLDRKSMKTVSDGDDVSVASSTVALKKSMGLIGGISFIIGTMIGSGIFVSPKGVLAGAGSVGLSLVIWGLAGFVSMMGAISYAELGTMITRSGGEYAYLREAFHPVFAYLFAFIQTLLLKPSSVAIISLTCGEYLAQPFFEDGCGAAPAYITKCLAMVVVLTVAAVNVLSVKMATQVQIVFTGAKLIALAIIILGGFVKLGQGYTDYLGSSAWDWMDGPPSVGSVALGFYSSMWAYDGWNNLNLIVEELHDAHKNLPRAILIGIPLVTTVYILTNISYFTVLSPEALLASPAVASSWAREVIPQFAWTIPIFVAMSTFGACNGSLFTTGRLVFVAAREGHMVKVLSFVHVRRFTPAPAIMFTVILAFFMLLPSDIETLIDFFSFAAWMFYAIVFCALIYLRFKAPDAVRPFKVPIVFPIIALVISVYLVFAPIIDQPEMAYLYALLFMLAGLIFYVPFVHYKKEIPGMEPFNVFWQLFLEIAPPPQYESDALEEYKNPKETSDEKTEPDENTAPNGIEDQEPNTTENDTKPNGDAGDDNETKM